MSKKELTLPSAPLVTKAAMLPDGLTITADEQGICTVKIVGTAEKNELQPFAGSKNHNFNNALIGEVLRVVNHRGSEADTATTIGAITSAMAAFKPKDEIEGMLAAQAVALHFTALACFGKAVSPNQHPDVASKLRKDGANLSRGMTDMLDALDRKRGKSPQVVRVERVVVHEGGRAIVGNVRPSTEKDRG